MRIDCNTTLLFGEMGPDEAGVSWSATGWRERLDDPALRRVAAVALPGKTVQLPAQRLQIGELAARARGLLLTAGTTANHMGVRHRFAETVDCLQARDDASPHRLNLPRGSLKNFIPLVARAG